MGSVVGVVSQRLYPEKNNMYEFCSRLSEFQAQPGPTEMSAQTGIRSPESQYTNYAIPTRPGTCKAGVYVSTEGGLGG
jgi:hypothetical protein